METLGRLAKMNGSKVSGRELRRALTDQGTVINQVLPVLEDIYASQNEIEQRLRWLLEIHGRGFWGRLKWLVRGV